jgi:hypothetical protein
MTSIDTVLGIAGLSATLLFGWLIGRHYYLKGKKDLQVQTKPRKKYDIFARKLKGEF